MAHQNSAFRGGREHVAPELAGRPLCRGRIGRPSLTRVGSNDFSEAQSYVIALHATGNLGETQLSAFADEGSFEKVVAAMSLMCDLPTGPVERPFVQNQTEQILVLAKAINLS